MIFWLTLCLLPCKNGNTIFQANVSPMKKNAVTVPQREHYNVEAQGPVPVYYVHKSIFAKGHKNLVLKCLIGCRIREALGNLKKGEGASMELFFPSIRRSKAYFYHRLLTAPV